MNMPKCRCAIRNVSWKGAGEWEAVVELEQFDKNLSKTTEKEILQGNILKFLLPDTLKTIF